MSSVSANALITATRVFQVVVFTVLTGFLVTIVLEKEAERWRRLMAASFAILCLGILIRYLDRIYEHLPWSWWNCFALVAAGIAAVGLYMGWRDKT